METNLKKTLGILGVFCFSLTSAVAGSYDTDDHDNQQNVAVPPAQYGSGDECPTIFVSASYTLWTARQGGLAVAADNFYNLAGTSSATTGTVYYPDWKLCSGFKVGLGANLHHDGWVAMAEYTWFYNRKNAVKNLFTGANGRAIATQTVTPVATDGVAQPYQLGSAAGRFENWFNRIDATLARSFYAGHYLTYKPWLGLIGAWDKEDVNNQVTRLSNSVTYRIDTEQKFWCVGPYAGTDAGFYLTKDWVLFIANGVALPWSKFDATTTVRNCGQSNADSSCTTISSTNNTFWNVAPMLESSLGLRWETWWSDHTWSFMLQAAWELQTWFDHNHAYNIGTADAQNGNYTMQGLTIKAQANF